MYDNNPYVTNNGFTQVPNAILTHYRYYPKFDGNVVAAYAFLLKNYNRQYGYAYPTQDQAALALNTTDTTFRKYVGIMVGAGLLEEPTKNKPFGNYVYRFRQPIEDAAEFFRTYPAAKEAYDKRAGQFDRLAAKKAADKTDWLARQEALDDITDWL